MENIVLDKNKIPTHVAIILDGNGRWAKQRHLPRVLGHRKGAFNIYDVAKAAEQKESVLSKWSLNVK